MKTINFLQKRTIVLIIIIAGAIIFASYNFIHVEKQDSEQLSVTDTPKPEDRTDRPIFNWRYEEASTLNPDGNPSTNVFLDVNYPNKTTLSKLIQNEPGSCNSLPDAEPGSVPNSVSIQCYYAGFGAKYKIVLVSTSYQIQKKEFEEGSPDYNPPEQQYKTVAEFPL